MKKKKKNTHLLLFKNKKGLSEYHRLKSFPRNRSALLLCRLLSSPAALSPGCAQQPRIESNIGFAVTAIKRQNRWALFFTGENQGPGQAPGRTPLALRTPFLKPEVRPAASRRPPGTRQESGRGSGERPPRESDGCVSAPRGGDWRGGPGPNRPCHRRGAAP